LALSVAFVGRAMSTCFPIVSGVETTRNLGARDLTGQRPRRLPGVALGFLDRSSRVVGGPGVPLDHHARQPAQRLTLPRAGDGAAEDRPPRTRLLVDPGRCGVARVDDQRDRFGRLAVNLRGIGRRRPGPAVPEDEGLPAPDARLAETRPVAERPER